MSCTKMSKKNCAQTHNPGLIRGKFYKNTHDLFYLACNGFLGYWYYI